MKSGLELLSPADRISFLRGGKVIGSDWVDLSILRQVYEEIRRRYRNHPEKLKKAITVDPGP